VNVYTWGDDPAQHEPFMRCTACNDDLCTVEEGDTLSVLVSVAEDHAPECAGSPPEVTR
jgi:hypothetical protein